MADPRHELGRAAEGAVAEWLTAHDWQILATRYRCPEGEVDLVALDPDRCLIGVEVRLRRTHRAGDALATVRPRHLRRVGAALASFARAAAIPHVGLRVDLVAVVPGPRSRTWRLTRLPAISEG
ncbi:MAG: YraN family protein [Candidatus Limnocylindria bacterium]